MHGIITIITAAFKATLTTRFTVITSPAADAPCGLATRSAIQAIIDMGDRTL